MGRSKQKKPESQQSEEDEYSIPEEAQAEEDEKLEMHAEDEQIDQLQVEHRRQLDVLQIIAAQTKEGSDGQRLTFLALYSLKQKEIELNQKMVEEINAAKDKFQLLKQPLYAKLVSAALGKTVEEELYKPKGVDTTVDLNKATPAPLPEFWATIFQKSGLIQDAQDFQAFRKLEEFTCQLLHAKTNHLRISFKFKDQPSLFSNKQLTIQVSTDHTNPQSSPKIIKKDTIKYKGKQNQNSVFTQLFGPSTNPHQVHNLVNQFYRDYCNSIYFYLRKDQQDIQQIIDVDEDQDSQDQDAKPAKPTIDSKAVMRKGKIASKQKKDLEKPECQNQ